MTVSSERQIIYPDSDGQPMADNTKQFRWIVLLKENLECLFAQNPDVFVAGDLLWYPVEGNPEIRVAPDVFVVFGRQKGDRGSYRQWLEDNIAPQVVFEILSPGNTLKEMIKKQQFYDRYGVEEYYIYNPENNELTGLQRLEDSLTVIEEIKNWTSPRLGIRFVVTPETLEVYYPDGTPFLTTIELKQRAENEKQRADSAESELAFIKQFLHRQGIEIPKMDSNSN
ncbi:Uma2 family endonuclease [Cyanobacterium aponinum FACHB-4101]|uniref:Uma2 family endonuclease n=1 Tax=Cyanobacterium aponinum TaxID=379064 RepID=UPI001680B127|nr:Uma2 family endonuclease [Cyanobacterium aponinum]MBD2394955.1 Uma2 family endonuclease [Cyanobacterium aponinum FACHB-4101]